MKIDLFEKNLHNYVMNLNENYDSDRIQGIFFLVQSFNDGKIDLYNRHTFYENYFLSQVKEYCQIKLILDWKFEYGTSVEKLSCNIYICCLCKDSSKIEYRDFAEGHFENNKFIYKER